MAPNPNKLQIVDKTCFCSVSVLCESVAVFFFYKKSYRLGARASRACAQGPRAGVRAFGAGAQVPRADAQTPGAGAQAFRTDARTHGAGEFSFRTYNLLTIRE